MALKLLHFCGVLIYALKNDMGNTTLLKARTLVLSVLENDIARNG